MKVCPACKEKKPLESFAKKRDKRQARCRKCHKQYTQRHYAENKQYYKDKAKYRKDEIRKIILRIKEGAKCSECSENHVACLEFHHRDPDGKDDNLAGAGGRGWSDDRLTRELEKCDILCANCHRKLHYNEKLRKMGSERKTEES